MGFRVLDYNGNYFARPSLFSGIFSKLPHISFVIKIMHKRRSDGPVVQISMQFRILCCKWTK